MVHGESGGGYAPHPAGDGAVLREKLFRSDDRQNVEKLSIIMYFER